MKIKSTKKIVFRIFIADWQDWEWVPTVLTMIILSLNPTGNSSINTNFWHLWYTWNKTSHILNTFIVLMRYLNCKIKSNFYWYCSNCPNFASSGAVQNNNKHNSKLLRYLMFILISTININFMLMGYFEILIKYWLVQHFQQSDAIESHSL